MDINYHIPKKCICGLDFKDNIPLTHFHSNQHNFFLADRRRELRELNISRGYSFKGDCEICKLTNLKDLDRHNLTNFHLRRLDSFQTHQYIKDKVLQHKKSLQSL